MRLLRIAGESHSGTRDRAVAEAQWRCGRENSLHAEAHTCCSMLHVPQTSYLFTDQLAPAMPYPASHLSQAHRAEGEEEWRNEGIISSARSTRSTHTPIATPFTASGIHERRFMPSTLGPTPSTAVAAASQRVSLVSRALALSSTSRTVVPAVPARTAPAAAAPAVATRLLLLEDGSAFGQWSDGCSLLLHPEARTLTLLLPDGSSMRVLASTTPSAARVKLVELLSFRNMVITSNNGDCAPALDRDTWRGDTFSSGKTYPFARWGLEARSRETDHQFFLSATNMTTEGLNESSEETSFQQQQYTRMQGDGSIICPAIHQPDGSVHVCAMDPRVSLTLLPNAHWVRLSYPLPLERRVERVKNNGAMEYSYLYADFAQLLPLAAVPTQWSFPLRCALQASHVHQIEAISRELDRAADGNTTAYEPQDTNDTLSTAPLDLVMDLPAVRPLRPAAVPSSSHSGTVASSSSLSWPEVPGHSLPLLHSIPGALPKDSFVRSLWTPEALFWTNILPSPPRAGNDHTASQGGDDEEDEHSRIEVIALVHVDQSCLILKQNGFIDHFLEPNEEVDRAVLALTATGKDETNARDTTMQQEGGASLRKRTYAPNTVPRVHNLTALAGEASYELAPLTQMMLRLCSHAAGILQERSLAARETTRALARLQDLSLAPRAALCSSEHAALSSLPAAALRAQAAREVTFSAEVVERAMQRGVGEFTAFKDGRVKVRFVDRCLLELRSSRMEANLLLPSGFPLTLSLPLSDAESDKYSQYVSPSLQFAAWAFQSPAERLEAQRKEQLQREWIQFEVERSKRNLALTRIARGESPYDLHEQTDQSSFSNASTVHAIFDRSDTSAQHSMHSTPHATPSRSTYSHYVTPADNYYSRQEGSSPYASATGCVSPVPSVPCSPAPSQAWPTPSASHCAEVHTSHQPSFPSPQHSGTAHLSMDSAYLSPVAATPVAAEQSLTASDVSYWLADLQHRNAQLQQQLLQTSARIDTLLPASS